MGILIAVQSRGGAQKVKRALSSEASADDAIVFQIADHVGHSTPRLYAVNEGENLVNDQKLLENLSEELKKFVNEESGLVLCVSDEGPKYKHLVDWLRMHEWRVPSERMGFEKRERMKVRFREALA